MPTADFPERKAKKVLWRVAMKDRHNGETICRTVSEKDPDGAYYEMRKRTIKETGMSEEAYDDTYRALPLGLE